MSWTDGLDAIRDVLAGHRRPTDRVAVPAGHGHVYNGEHVDGWVSVLQPSGWTDERSAELRAIVTVDE